MQPATCPGLPAICLSLSLLLPGCAAPGEGLWPPPPDAAVHSVFVSLDTWHAVIAFPHQQEAIGDQPSELSFETDQPGQHSALRTQHLFEEWGYAERAWYIEGQTGLIGVFRALVWPTDGVVEVGHYDRVWADRTPQPPSDLFVFRVSEEGYRRLRRHLRSTVSSVEPVATIGQSIFYPAVRAYHLFHTCHQYAAHALREAGLPLSAFWAFNRASLAWQLRRAARIAAEQAANSPAVESR